MSLKTYAIIFFILYIWIVTVMIFNLKPSSSTQISAFFGKVNVKDDILASDVEHYDDEANVKEVEEPESLCDYDDVKQKCEFNLSDTRWRTLGKSRALMLPPAYYDDRKEGDAYIRILALLEGHPANKFSSSSLPQMQCRFPLCDGSLKLVPATIYPFNENMGKRYGGYIVSCSLTGVEKYMKHTCDVTLSLDSKEEELQSVTLPVMTWNKWKEGHTDTERDADGAAAAGIAVCVPPLYGNVEPERLVEFVELHTMLGVNHIFFYNYTGDSRKANFNPSTNAILEYYSKLGTVTAYQWTLPLSTASVRYYGQLTTVHHCMYSAMYRYKYVAFIDIDEFLLPRDTVTWPEMLAEVDDDTHCGFRFLCSFFRPPLAVKWTNPLTLTWTTRAWGMHSKRSKCIVRPERMFEMGVHHMSKWNEERWTPKTVNYSVAQVHHYRTSCVQDFARTNDCDVLEDDETALRYKTELIDRYSHAFRAIFGSDGRTEHEPPKGINIDLGSVESKLGKEGLAWYKRLLGLSQEYG